MGAHVLEVCASAAHPANNKAIPAIRAPAKDICSPMDQKSCRVIALLDEVPLTE